MTSTSFSLSDTADRVRTAPLDQEKAVDLSVVIVNYNSHDVTRQAIESILRHHNGYSVEIIIVDNDSSDDSIERLRSEFPGVSVLAAGHNGGYAWGNNVGMGRARGRYVLILNPDAMLTDETLKTAISYMDDHPEVGILGARVSYEDGTTQSSFFRFPSLWQMALNVLVPNKIARKSVLLGDQRYASRDPNAVGDVDVVSGCFMLLPRRVIEQIGPMNDRFFMYSEESEWCWRIRKAGYAVRYHPDVAITHYGAATTGQTSPWKAIEIAKGQILFLRMTRGRFVAWLATLLMLLGDLIRGIGLLPVMLFRPRSEKVSIWRARTAFLLRALVRQPVGQTPPPPVIEES